jgi:hypothetical protein
MVGFIVNILSAQVLVESKYILIKVVLGSVKREAPADAVSMTYANFLYCRAEHGLHGMAAPEPCVRVLLSEVCGNHVQAILHKLVEDVRVAGVWPFDQVLTGEICARYFLGRSEEIVRLQRREGEEVIVAVNEMFSQAGDAMQEHLNRADVEARQMLRRHELTMIDNVDGWPDGSILPICPDSFI